MPALSVDGLEPKQEEAILALLNEPSMARAAASVGIGERTLYRWLRDPAFGSAYREARRQAFRHAIALTQKYAPMAVATLAKVMADEQAPWTAKVAAATTILRFGREGIELDDLVERIEAIEHSGKVAGVARVVGVVA